ncbi:hypothetical protein SCUP515_11013 [Seiridium cupressi]
MFPPPAIRSPPIPEVDATDIRKKRSSFLDNLQDNPSLGPSKMTNRKKPKRTHPDQPNQPYSTRLRASSGRAVCDTTSSPDLGLATAQPLCNNTSAAAYNAVHSNRDAQRPEATSRHEIPSNRSSASLLVQDPVIYKPKEKLDSGEYGPRIRSSAPSPSNSLHQHTRQSILGHDGRHRNSICTQESFEFERTTNCSLPSTEQQPETQHRAIRAHGMIAPSPSRAPTGPFQRPQESPVQPRSQFWTQWLSPVARILGIPWFRGHYENQSETQQNLVTHIEPSRTMSAPDNESSRQYRTQTQHTVSFEGPLAPTDPDREERQPPRVHAPAPINRRLRGPTIPKQSPHLPVSPPNSCPLHGIGTAQNRHGSDDGGGDDGPTNYIIPGSFYRRDFRDVEDRRTPSKHVPTASHNVHTLSDIHEPSKSQQNKDLPTACTCITRARGSDVKGNRLGSVKVHTIWD